MRNRLTPLLIIPIMLFAAGLRLTAVDWDNYHHYHPDERYITWVATSIEWPTESEGGINWPTALDPRQSTFNPYYWSPQAESKGIVVMVDEARRFAYGHLPLYLGVSATRLVERWGPKWATHLPPEWLLTRDILNQADKAEFWHLTAVARALTALIDTATVGVLFLLGRRLFDTAVALLSAAFLAVNVLHIQLAHFFAFDPYMTFFVVLALYGMVAASQQRTAGGWAFYFGLAALATGWAIGSKFAAILLLLPLLLTARHRQRRPIAPLFIGLGLTFSAFALTNPFALLDRGCEVISPALDWGPIQIPALDWGYCFLDNIGRQGGMVRGTTDFFFTRQYTGLTNYLYEIEMQVKWGMGPFLGLAAFIGLGWAIGQGGAFVYQAMQERHQRPLTHLPLAEFLLLAWILPYFLINGNFYVKFMRYMQPIIPFLMLYAAVWLCHTLPSRYRPLSVTLVLTTTTLYALSFVNLYAQPHPWETASHWIYTHIPAGATLLGELWDDDLPSLALEIDGQQHTRRNYTIDDLTWLSDPDQRASNCPDIDRGHRGSGRAENDTG